MAKSSNRSASPSLASLGRKDGNNGTACPNAFQKKTLLRLKHHIVHNVANIPISLNVRTCLHR